MQEVKDHVTYVLFLRMLCNPAGVRNVSHICRMIMDRCCVFVIMFGFNLESSHPKAAAATLEALTCLREFPFIRTGF